MNEVLFIKLCFVVWSITLGELRDLINSSRKYTLAVLEYYDKNRITKKDGDLRRLVGFPE